MAVRKPPMGPFENVTSDEVENESTLPGATVTDALNNAASGGGATRKSREIYFADGSKQTITASGTVNTTSSVWPDLTTISGGLRRFWLVPGGSGGGRGQRQLLSGTPGRGGIGGGAVFDRTFADEDIQAYVTAVGGSVAITVGQAGVGAAGIAAGTSTVSGARGTMGTLTAFGTLFAAYPGGLQAVAVGLPGAGGGWLGPGQTNASGDASGGQPGLNTASVEKDGNFGGGHGPGVTNDPSTNRVGASIYGGGAGGTSNQELATSAAARPAGSSLFGVPGSGAGGGVNTAIPAGGRGGDAGRRGVNLSQAEPPASVTGGGPLGGAGGVDASGQPGADGAAGILGLYPGESGAGSGGVISTVGGADLTVARGGDGGFPGGSGGSSGDAFPFGGRNIAIDRGGNGAAGVAVIDTF